MIIPPAKRLSKIETYYFAKKLVEVDLMNRDGGIPVINLGIGSPDLLPPPASVAEINGAVLEDGAHKYQSYRGIPDLRKAISAWYYRHFSVTLNEGNEILPLIGSKEGIMHISQAFINPGDGVLVPNPGYPAYTAITEICGGKVMNYRLSEQNNWLPDFAELEKIDLSGVKIMWINYPHMPTGAKANEALFKEIIAFGKKHKILICHDNPYTFILNDHPRSILSVEGAMDVALELTSLSKNYNMAGWRIGALAGGKEYIDTVLKFKSNMDSGMFKPMQKAAIAALSQGPEWHDGINAHYRTRREEAWKIMDLIGCTYDRETAGMFVWGKIPNHVKTGEELCDRFLYEARVFITPGHIFGSQGNTYVRISLCSDVPTLISARERIAQVLKAETV